MRRQAFDPVVVHGWLRDYSCECSGVCSGRLRALVGVKSSASQDRAIRDAQRWVFPYPCGCNSLFTITNFLDVFLARLLKAPSDACGACIGCSYVDCRCLINEPFRQQGRDLCSGSRWRRISIKLVRTRLLLARACSTPISSQAHWSLKSQTGAMDACTVVVSGLVFRISKALATDAGIDVNRAERYFLCQDQ